MTAAATNLYLSVDQVALRYNVSKDSIWRWKRKGDFPAPVKLGESVILPPRGSTLEETRPSASAGSGSPPAAPEAKVVSRARSRRRVAYILVSQNRFPSDFILRSRNEVYSKNLPAFEHD